MRVVFFSGYIPGGWCCEALWMFISAPFVTIFWFSAGPSRHPRNIPTDVLALVVADGEEKAENRKKSANPWARAVAWPIVESSVWARIALATSGEVPSQRMPSNCCSSDAQSFRSR